LRYLSVCSGIEAASVAWEPLGWEAAAFSEIDAFPAAVLKHRFPGVPVHGDFTTIGADQYGPVQLLVGGTPCQSFSVAGKRGGMADGRGNLALEYIRLAHRSRARWVVWENVPGVFSSNEGEDFRCFLSGLVRWDVPLPEGGWQNTGVVAAGPADGAYGVAWRVLDAQYAGVPQRRRRVFVVGYLGDWRRAAAVLLERESLSGDTPPRRSPRQGSASGFETGPGGGRETDLAPTLDARCKDGPRRNQLAAGVLEETVGTLRCRRPGEGGVQGDFDHVIPDTSPALNTQSGGHHAPDTKAYVAYVPDVCGTLSDGAHMGGGLNGQDAYSGRIIAPPIAHTPAGHGDYKEGIGTVRANGGDAGAGSETLVTGEPQAFYSTESGFNKNPEPGLSPPLKVGGLAGSPVAIAFSCKDSGQDAGEVSPTLRSMAEDKDNANGGGQVAVFDPNQVTCPDNRSQPQEGISHSLPAKGNAPVAFSIMPMNSGTDYKARETDVAQPLMAGGPVGGNQGGDFVAQAFKASHYTRDKDGAPSETCPPLSADADKGDQDPLAFVEGGHGVTMNEVTEPLASGGGKPGQGYAAAMTTSAVRRLTPRECERLQGFPDDFTLVPYRGKEAADGPRYKALGNSMAVPCMRWIGERIQMVEELEG
jgi:DNA (cytosine-5)-methyltransferase 1